MHAPSIESPISPAVADGASELLRSLALLPRTIRELAARESLTTELRLAAIVAYAARLEAAIAEEAA
jgi:hypothetical protein